MEDLEIENGCLGEGASNNDFLLDEGLADGLPTLFNQDEERYYYNQGNQDWSKKSCTIFSALGAISDLWNHEFSLDEIKEYDEKSYSNGRIRGQGWYTKSAVDLCCKLWNEKHPDKRVAYYRIDMDNDALIEKVVSKNYNICSGYYGNVKWQNDYYYDAILDGTEFGASTYGHAINIIKYNGKVCVKDSYKGRTGKNKIETNIYSIKNPLSKVVPFHAYGYVITKVSEDNYDEVERLNKLKSKINTVIPLLSEIWNLVNDKDYQNTLHDTNEKNRKKLNDVENELKKFS